MNDVGLPDRLLHDHAQPVTWRWSHARHHTDTIIVGRDPEIAVMRPPDLLAAALNFIGMLDACYALPTLFRNAFGGLSAEEKTYIPEMEQPKAIRRPRLACGDLRRRPSRSRSAMRSFLPLMLIGLPRLYGAWHMVHDRPAAAWRAGRQRHRPPAEQPHGLHEPGQPLHLLEHELPCGAPHVPDGALSRAAEAARADQARPAGAQPVDLARLPRDAAGLPAPAALRGLLPQARTAADGASPIASEFHDIAMPAAAE